MTAVSPEPLSTVVRPRLPTDLSLTLRTFPRGDRAWLVEPSGTWHATSTPDGPATIRLSPRAGATIEIDAWGPGRERAVAAAPDLLGARDSLDGFDPPPGIVRDLHRRLRGLRISRSGAVFEALVPLIVEQKVIGADARASYRRLVAAWGERAPGPMPLMTAPSPKRLAAEPYFAYHPFGIEARRAGFVREAAVHARRLEEAASMPLSDAYRRLRALHGVGAWTAAEVAIVALGDADAVSIGDYHLPDKVAWALAGEPRGTDERMLELLAPYAGHRGRVIRLLEAARIEAPRFGPRMARSVVAGR